MQADEAPSAQVVSLQIGDEVPNFSCESHMGVVNLHDYIDGGWGVILAFPKTEDPVACSQLGMIAKLSEEFEARNCKLLAISIGSISGHRSFIKETQELQTCKVKFPLIADTSAQIFQALGLIRSDAVELTKAALPQTSIFIIDLDKRIRLMQYYPITVGQNYYETLRAIDALQIGTPANWKSGEDVFISPTIPTNTLSQMFPKGHVELRRWFRITAQPDEANNS